MTQYQSIHNGILFLLSDTSAKEIYRDPNTGEVDTGSADYYFVVEAIGPITSTFDVSLRTRNFSRERAGFEWLARGAFDVPVDFVSWEDNIAEKAQNISNYGDYSFILELVAVEYAEPPRGEDTAVQVSLTFNVNTMRKR